MLWDSFENCVWMCGGLSHGGAKSRRRIWCAGDLRRLVCLAIPVPHWSIIQFRLRLRVCHVTHDVKRGDCLSSFDESYTCGYGVCFGCSHVYLLHVTPPELIRRLCLMCYALFAFFAVGGVLFGCFNTAQYCNNAPCSHVYTVRSAGGIVPP